MVKTRLISLLKDSKKHIYYKVLWQWAALIAQIAIVYCISAYLFILIGVIKSSSLSLDNFIIDKNVFNTALFNKFIIDFIFMHIKYFVAILILMFLRRYFDKKATYASYEAGVDVKRKLRMTIYNKLLALGSAYREKISTAEVVQMSVEGVEQLEIYFGRYLPQLFYSLLAPLTLFLILSFVSFKAALVLLLCVPLIPLSIVMIQKIAKKLLSKYWTSYTNLGDSFLENLQGLSTLKIYNADEDKTKVMDEEAEIFRKVTMKVLMMQLNSISVMDIMAYGGAAVGMFFSIKEYYNQNITLQGALFIILLASEFFIPLRILGSFFHIAMNGMAASDKIFRLLDMQEPSLKEALIAKDNFQIDFDNVNFKYNSDRSILANISLKIPKGSFVALTGLSGCGKSTIAKLLMGRNKNYQGSIKIGDVELSEINETDINKNITLVTHNSYLFKGSVKENLLIAKPDAGDEELLKVLGEVNLLNFLNEQKGLETMILEKGSNLSGGQAQRLALARGLLHDSIIYIFDEATSNIDKESEAMIMEVIIKLAKSKTVILISHRLANVVNADNIYMLKDGMIVESGTHEELMNNKKAYSQLYNWQASLEAYSKEA